MAGSKQFDFSVKLLLIGDSGPFHLGLRTYWLLRGPHEPAGWRVEWG